MQQYSCRRLWPDGTVFFKNQLCFLISDNHLYSGSARDASRTSGAGRTRGARGARGAGRTSGARGARRTSGARRARRTSGTGCTGGTRLARGASGASSTCRMVAVYT